MNAAPVPPYSVFVAMKSKIRPSARFVQSGKDLMVPGKTECAVDRPVLHNNA